MSWNENEILAACIKVFEAARDMLAGNLSYIEGARIIFFAWRGTKLNEQDVDYTAMVAIHSETDALPFGEHRSHWNATALAGLKAHSSTATVQHQVILGIIHHAVHAAPPKGGALISSKKQVVK